MRKIIKFIFKVILILFLSIVGVFIYIRLFRMPVTKYDCYKLGSDAVRVACIKYYF